MSTPRQMPILRPAKPEDIHRATAFGDTITLFQAELRKEGKSDHTIKAFTSDLQLLAEHHGDSTPVGDFTTTRLNEFLHWMETGRGVPCSRKTYARRVTTLKVYFKWLHAIGAISHDPAKPVLQRSGPAPLSLVLRPNEVDRAYAYTDRLRHAAKADSRPGLLFRLLVDTGAKKSEITRLTPEDIDRHNPDRPILTIRHKSARSQYRERRIELQAETVEALDEYLAQRGVRPVIFDCTARNLEYILEDVGEGASIPFKVSFEIMRWTSAVRDYRAGVEPGAIRDKLGLSDVSWYETFAKIKRLTELQVQREEGALAPLNGPAPATDK